MLKFVVKTENLSVAFLKSQLLVQFLPIMKVSLQDAKKDDPYISYWYLWQDQL